MKGIMVKEGDFEELVKKSLDELPDEFKKRLDNVEIVVEDWPSPSIVKKMGGSRYILGLYRGVPLPRRGKHYAFVLPDMITIFKGPIKRMARTRGSLEETIRRVLIHEIGHFLGFSEDELRKMGL